MGTKISAPWVPCLYHHAANVSYLCSGNLCDHQVRCHGTEVGEAYSSKVEGQVRRMVETLEIL